MASFYEKYIHRVYAFLADQIFSSKFTLIEYA